MQIGVLSFSTHSLTFKAGIRLWAFAAPVLFPQLGFTRHAVRPSLCFRFGNLSLPVASAGGASASVPVTWVTAPSPVDTCAHS